ncbi:cytochrome P450 [Pseudonocardia sp. GCM10023141]|uniref:cytochrome P450 n=1 Tax=Pseudonocardia sp. GCM10023141 TaxID=3252653 RepID=UPI0036179A82
MTTTPFDPLSIADNHNAETTLSAARRSCPVSQPYPHVNVVASDDRCREVLLDPAVYSNHFNFILEDGPAPTERTGDYKFITRIDPPEHTALRRFLRRWFSPAGLRSLEPAVRKIVDDVVGNLPDRGTVDLFSDVAHLVPARTVYTLLGIPPADWSTIQEWSDQGNQDLPRQNPEATGRVRDYLIELLAARRTSGERHDDVIDGFLYPGEDPPFAAEDIVQHIRQLIAAGTDTTSGLIVNVFYRLLEDDARWNRLVGDPALSTPAVEESLRRDSPIQYTLRTVAKEADLGGCPVMPRDRVVVSLQSANWDEESWGENALDYDLDRPGPAGHIAFGSGIHSCLGAPLARLEARLTLEVMAATFPALHLAEGFNWVPIESLQMRRPKALPAELGGRKQS